LLRLLGVDDSNAGHRLAGVVEKFNRSKEQFDEFRAELDVFLDSPPEPYFSVGDFDEDTWEWIERFQIRKDFPLRFGVILGDSIHNLRSALDHLICQVTLLDLPAGESAEGVCDQTQFPIASKDERQFEDMANFRIPRLSEMHRAMVKHMQPYHAGDKAARHPLSILAELSNADKHRLVNPTYSFMASDVTKAVESIATDPDSPIVETRIIKRGHRMEHETPWLRLRFRRDSALPAKVQVNANPTIGIALGEVGLDIMAFKELGESVWKIIAAFMQDFPETEFTH
jgi:hypothetical protein